MEKLESSTSTIFEFEIFEVRQNMIPGTDSYLCKTVRMKIAEISTGKRAGMHCRLCRFFHNEGTGDKKGKHKWKWKKGECGKSGE